MDSIETLIPDNEGNHLMVVLNFYDDDTKERAFSIFEEFGKIEIADIFITKLNPNRPINNCVFFKMCLWLSEQISMFPNAVFWFICSTKELATNHPELTPAQYRRHLFDYFYQRNINRLNEIGIESKEIIVGSGENQTYARIFYRPRHAPILHIVTATIQDEK